ncbi:MAG: hypothetical protein OXH59_04965 [Rhodospirillaceae bacterium]|nr:hypothetical protein [Rhodospirillaceae bacterium]
MTIAVPGALAALLTLLAFVAPALLGPALVLALAASAFRLATLMLLRRAAHRPEAPDDAPVQRGLRILFLGEALFAAATVYGLPVEPLVEAPVEIGGSEWAGWAGLAVWLGYGAACAWGGLKLLGAPGWLRAGGILVAVAAGLWFTWIGLLLWPFAMAAGYGCFAVYGIKIHAKTKH